MRAETLLKKDLLDEITGFHYHYITQIKSITKSHDHDFCEIFLVAKGNVLHLIGGREEKLLEGTLVLIRPYDVHGFLPDGDSACCVANLAFRAEWLEKALCYLLDGHGGTFLTAKAPPQTLLPLQRRQPALRGLNELNAANVKAVIVALLTDLLYPPKAVEKPAGEPEWLTHLVNTMRRPAHFTRGVKQMQELSGKSPEHMNRMFKRFYHLTPSAFVNELKTAYAASLLTHTDMPIVDVALEAGFENLSYFYNRFKVQYRQTPQKYRMEAHRAKSIP